MKKIIMIAVSFLLTIILLSTGIVFAQGDEMKKSVDIFYPNDSFWEPGVCYGRVIELQHNSDKTKNGWLLSTSEKWGMDNGLQKHSFAIFCSRDYGNSWLRISDVSCEELDGMNWQPTLFELEKQVGDMPVGTLLCSGVCYKRISETEAESHIKLFKSADGGLSWEYVTEIASATGSSESGVWEPFFVQTDDGRLICYYSDSRDYKNHSQKLVHQVSEDGVNWQEVVDDVAVKQQKLRPGMATVARMKDGRYIMTYEVVNLSGNPIFYRYSDDALNWGDATNLGTQIVCTSGSKPGSAPYVIYTPMGGENGLLIVTSSFETPADVRNGSSLFISKDFGKTWEEALQPLIFGQKLQHDNLGYSSGMFVSDGGKTIHYVNTVDYTSKYAKLSYTQLQLDENAIISSGIPAFNAYAQSQKQQNGEQISEKSSDSVNVIKIITIALAAVLVLTAGMVVTITIKKIKG